MRVAVFSDVHGNLPALEAFAKHVKGEVDGYLCLGDVVNYGPWSDECLELVFSLPGVTVLEGNHERLFLGVENIGHEIPLVQAFFAHAIADFKRIDLIRNLPLTFVLGGFTGTHTIDDKRVYRDTSIEVDRSYLIGHTHHAFDVRRSGHRIVNCGSLGQNRKDLSRASYAVVDLRRDHVSFHELSYDCGPLLAEMRRRGFARECMEYYRSKLPGRAVPA